MQPLLLFGLFCIFPTLFCYKLETAEIAVEEDGSSMVDIAGEVDEEEASDPGLGFSNVALDMFSLGNRHCPYCNGCRCRGSSCYCTKRGVVVNLAFSNPRCCGPTITATFKIKGQSFSEKISGTNGCRRICKTFSGTSYCFNFCIRKFWHRIVGRINQMKPNPMYIGRFNFYYW